MIHQVISGKCFNWGFPYKNMERREEHLGAEAFSRVQTRQKAGAVVGGSVPRLQLFHFTLKCEIESFFGATAARRNAEGDDGTESPYFAEMEVG